MLVIKLGQSSNLSQAFIYVVCLHLSPLIILRIILRSIQLLQSRWKNIVHKPSSFSNEVASFAASYSEHYYVHKTCILFLHCGNSSPAAIMAKLHWLSSYKRHQGGLPPQFHYYLHCLPRQVALERCHLPKGTNPATAAYTDNVVG